MTDLQTIWVLTVDDVLQNKKAAYNVFTAIVHMMKTAENPPLYGQVVLNAYSGFLLPPSLTTVSPLENIEQWKDFFFSEDFDEQLECLLYPKIVQCDVATASFSVLQKVLQCESFDEITAGDWDMLANEARTTGDTETDLNAELVIGCIQKQRIDVTELFSQMRLNVELGYIKGETIQHEDQKVEAEKKETYDDEGKQEPNEVVDEDHEGDDEEEESNMGVAEEVHEDDRQKERGDVFDKSDGDCKEQKDEKEEDLKEKRDEFSKQIDQGGKEKPSEVSEKNKKDHNQPEVKEGGEEQVDTLMNDVTGEGDMKGTGEQDNICPTSEEVCKKGPGDCQEQQDSVQRDSTSETNDAQMEEEEDEQVDALMDGDDEGEEKEPVEEQEAWSFHNICPTSYHACLLLLHGEQECSWFPGVAKFQRLLRIGKAAGYMRIPYEAMSHTTAIGLYNDIVVMRGYGLSYFAKLFEASGLQPEDFAIRGNFAKYLAFVKKSKGGALPSYTEGNALALNKKRFDMEMKACGDCHGILDNVDALIRRRLDLAQLNSDVATQFFWSWFFPSVRMWCRILNHVENKRWGCLKFLSHDCIRLLVDFIANAKLGDCFGCTQKAKQAWKKAAQEGFPKEAVFVLEEQYITPWVIHEMLEKNGDMMVKDTERLLQHFDDYMEVVAEAVFDISNLRYEEEDVKTMHNLMHSEFYKTLTYQLEMISDGEGNDGEKDLSAFESPDIHFNLVPTLPDYSYEEDLKTRPLSFWAPTLEHALAIAARLYPFFWDISKPKLMETFNDLFPNCEGACLDDMFMPNFQSWSEKLEDLLLRAEREGDVGITGRQDYYEKLMAVLEKLRTDEPVLSPNFEKYAKNMLQFVMKPLEDRELLPQEYVHLPRETLWKLAVYEMEQLHKQRNMAEETSKVLTLDDGSESDSENSNDDISYASSSEEQLRLFEGSGDGKARKRRRVSGNDTKSSEQSDYIDAATLGDPLFGYDQGDFLETIEDPSSVQPLLEAPKEPLQHVEWEDSQPQLPDNANDLDLSLDLDLDKMGMLLPQPPPVDESVVTKSQDELQLEKFLEQFKKPIVFHNMLQMQSDLVYAMTKCLKQQRDANPENITIQILPFDGAQRLVELFPAASQLQCDQEFEVQCSDDEMTLEEKRGVFHLLELRHECIRDYVAYFNTIQLMLRKSSLIGDLLKFSVRKTLSAELVSMKQDESMYSKEKEVFCKADTIQSFRYELKDWVDRPVDDSQLAYYKELSGESV